jgi:hypothetical protein
VEGHDNSLFTQDSTRLLDGSRSNVINTISPSWFPRRRMLA